MRLTDKQRAVFDLLLQHYQSKEIALRLGLSPATVEERTRAARERYGGVSRTEAIRLYAHEIAGGEGSALRLIAARISELSRPSAAGDPARFSLQRVILAVIVLIGTTLVGLQIYQLHADVCDKRATLEQGFGNQMLAADTHSQVQAAGWHLMSFSSWVP